MKKDEKETCMSSLDPAHIAHSIVVAGKNWAVKNAEASAMEETKKSFRAQIMSEYFEQANSMAKAEALADADERMMKFILEMVEKRKEANKAKVVHQTMLIKVDIMRSLESTKRAEMGIR
jgi:hypothetical protein